MKRAGVHHIGVASYDYDATVDFYTRVLGWQIAWQDVLSAPDGTPMMKHVFFDTGDGSYLAVMCPTPEMPNHPKKWATDINSGLGVMNGAYHFAFWVDTVEDLEARQAQIRSQSHPVTEIIDHAWCKSIYFRTSDGLLLEFCVTTRKLAEDDKLLKHRYQPGNSIYKERPDLVERDAAIFGMPPEQLLGVFGGRQRECEPVTP
jgi:catechol 2,3-dioxygenase-like lactoylglutathione lyase family enzyme